MDFKIIPLPGSRQKLKTRFHSDFKSRYKHIALDEFKQSLNSPLRTIRTSSFDLTKHNVSKTIKDPPEVQLGHYENLFMFKELVPKPKEGLFNSKKAIKVSNKNSRNTHPPGSEIWEKLNQNTLKKALSILRSAQLQDICWAYKRQLRQFCLEVLSHLST